MIYVSTTASLVPSRVNEMLLCFICCDKPQPLKKRGEKITKQKKLLAYCSTHSKGAACPSVQDVTMSFRESRSDERHIRGLNRNAPG